MKITVRNKQYGIDSIEFAGDTLEALVYEIDAPETQPSVNIPFITKKEIDAYITAQGGLPEDLEDFTTYDYFTTFYERIEKAIDELYVFERAKAKIAFTYLIAGFIIAHVSTVWLFCTAPWYIAPIFYFAYMLHLNYFGRKNNFIK